jgi:hypothetical protein
VWTDARVAQWEQTGDRPAVAVWTAEQIATFLGAVGDDSLFACWWLTALRGLRRGEMCGLRWTDIDLDRGMLTIERNRTTAGYQVVEGDPKTPAGRRTVALDIRTVQVLRAHRRRQGDQRAQAAEAGQPWTDTGYVFTRADGLPINPNYATTRFRKLVQRIGLPPVRLHDLRHGAASLAHQAGADLKTLQDLLGHSSILVTADTYTSVLPEVQRRCADATAHLVLTAARHTRKKITNKARKNRPDRRPKTGAPTPAAPAPRLKTQAHGRDARRTIAASGTHMAPTRHPPSEQDEERKRPDPHSRRSDALWSCAPEGIRTPNLLIRRAGDDVIWRTVVCRPVRLGRSADALVRAVCPAAPRAPADRLCAAVPKRS